MKLLSKTYIEDEVQHYHDLTIPGTHTYVLANGVVVHNCGTGVGFSCERQEIDRLPRVPVEMVQSDNVISVGDSKEGWARALNNLLNQLWSGEIPKIDYSKVRPAGARLKTFGGRASGPEPLKKLFAFAINLFKGAAGRKLRSIEVHDLMCMIGEIVVVGGVRRSALISLSNLSDLRMRDAKSGQWWNDHPYRGLANNSVAYTEKPSSEVFMEEWLSLVKSKSGERGIINRKALQAQASRWGRRAADLNYGVNPCAEIILRDKQLCNLTEVVVRADDTLESLKRKVRIATILGTLQATLTSFKFVNDTWSNNTAEEALLGVSLTGIKDNKLMSGRLGVAELTEVLNSLRDYAREVNLEWAGLLGINPSAAITTVKPSGTVSQLVNSASGIHERHNKRYIRTVRIDKKDTLYQFLVDKGFTIEDESLRPDSTAVISFAMTAPDDVLLRDDVNALEALNIWLVYQREWCEHKPSITVTVRDEEWPEVGAWVWKHFDEVSGVSFLPHSDHTYQQAPFQDLTEAEYEQWLRDHPQPTTVDWRDLGNYEATDNTIAMQTLACTAGVCELN